MTSAEMLAVAVLCGAVVLGGPSVVLRVCKNIAEARPQPGEVWVKQSDDPFIKPSEVWYVVSTGYGRETGYHYVQCTNAAGVSKSDISSVFTCRYTRQTKEAK